MKKFISIFVLFSILIAPIRIPTAEAVANWDTTGSYVFRFNYEGGDYDHNVILSQTGDQVTGTGSHNAYAWTITPAGVVSGDNINLTAQYTASADAVTPLTTMNITGTIAPGGTMSGTWTDNYQGTERSGTWMTTSGNAVSSLPTYVKVTIAKYVNGVPATVENTMNASFPMTSTWTTTNVGSGTGNYNLSATGFNNPNPYQATTSDMNRGADYSTYENASTSCEIPNMYALAGYSTGNTLAEAEMNPVSMDVPALTNIQNDKFIIVWNKTCVSTPVHLTPANNSTHLSSANTLIDWTDSISWAGSLSYIYEASNSIDTNPDGSFVSPVYTSATLNSSEIISTNAPLATYFWNVRAQDAGANFSNWTLPWKLVISNSLENTVVVTKNTSMAENEPGWMFNRDLSTQTPYEFNNDEKSIGIGSLYVLPIGETPADKFIAENFLNKPIAEVESISYDFMIGEGGEATQEEQFYMNVYANFGVSDDLKFYDCRYNVVPTIGSTGGFTTVTFDPTMSYPVTTRTGGSASPFTCPAIPADMDDLSPGSNIRVFALNLGDTSISDQGLDGYFDKVVVKANNVTTTYDFEKFQNVGVITNPTLDQVVSETINLSATYDDNDAINDDTVNWAVRKDSCTANTVFGNVDGFNNSYVWDGAIFNAELDTTSLEEGTYCFVFNPTDDAGQYDVRETVTFKIDNAPDAFQMSPMDGAVEDGVSLVQVWGSHAPDISHFLYESWHDQAATSLRWSQTLTATSKTAPNVPNAEFWWRVRAVDLNGNMSPWTPLWKITIYNTPDGDSEEIQYGTLMVKKIVINNENGTMTAGDFSFTIDGQEIMGYFEEEEGNPLLGEHRLRLPVGTYTVRENDAPNYAGASVNCTDIVISEEQTTTCTFTNDDFVHSGGGSGGAPTVAGASTETPNTGTPTDTGNQTPTGQVLGESTCSAIYLNDFLAFGKKNNPEQVKLLQIFLNEELALSPALVVDGVFGESTKSAVIAFQEKYASEILTPWAPFGLSNGKGTGYVYKTTKWKINMIKCSDLKLVVPQLP